MRTGVFILTFFCRPAGNDVAEFSRSLRWAVPWAKYHCPQRRTIEASTRSSCVIYKLWTKPFYTKSTFTGNSTVHAANYLLQCTLSRTVCKAHLKSHLFPISCRTRANAMHECVHIRRAIYATLHYRWLTGFDAHLKTFIFFTRHALSGIHTNDNNRNMRYFLSYQIKALYLSIS